jgi:hypothetical protein
MAVDTFTPTASKPEGMQIIASFESYAAAQRAVDRLADDAFPVDRVNIVGRGLTFVENVIGRRTYGRAAGEGALGGAVLAGFLGVLFGLLDWFDPLISALLLGLYGVLFGAALGAVIGLLAHAMTEGKRDFSSIRSLSADRFDVLADAEVADDAKARLEW